MAKEVGSLRTKLSFEKSGDSNLTDLKRDLKGISSEMNNFRSSGRDYRTSLKGMRQESDILTSRLKVQREQVAELKRRYDESRKATGENSAKTKDLAAQYNNANAQMKKTEGQLDRLNGLIRTQESNWTKLGDRMEKFGGKLTKFGDKATRFGKTYTMRVTTPIVAAGIAALKVGMDFGEGMSKVQAISGATGDELEAMRDQAKELGETTRFSATEAASGMEFLAMAGFETNEIISAMPGLLDLAASSGMDLGRAADIASNIISGFGLEAAESGRVADVLAKGASTANTNVEQLGEAMKYVAPVASTLDLGIEGLTASIGLLGDAGIQGGQAGRQLRQGLVNLANPTGKAADLIKELGINTFDADGNMKEMHEVVGELENGMEGMDAKTRAASLSILFGSNSMAGWATLLEQGSDKLRDYTKDLEDSEGAAKEMADIMQDNAKGAITELKSALEGAGIAISEHLIPAVTDGVKWITDLVRKFGDLDESQQKNIIKWAGIVAAIGPASIAIGGVAKIAGGFLTVGGKLFQLMGRSSGAGLIGRFALMGGPAGPVILAAGAFGLLSVAAYNLFKDKEKLHNITTETADKFTEQADALEPLVERYDELELVSKLTTDQFGRMIDIQDELERTQNPAKVAELKDEYEQLREKSGLTNDEIAEMVGLNNDIIEQSPNVEKSFTDKGNAVVESTDAIYEYIQSLRDMAMAELIDQRELALINEQTLLNKIKEDKEEISRLDERQNELAKLRNVPLSEIEERIEEINRKTNEGMLTQEEYNALQEEMDLLVTAENGLINDTITGLINKKAELNDNIKLNEEELAKLEEINIAIIDNLLAQVDLNFSKGEGLDQLDESIQKLKDERAELVENFDATKDDNAAHQDKLDLLDDSIRLHENVRDEIFDITEYQTEQNRKLDIQNEKIEKARELFGNTAYEIKESGKVQVLFNKRIEQGTDEARDQNKVLGTGVTKRVIVDDKGDAKRISTEAARGVVKSVRLNASWTGLGPLSGALPAYAKGTKNHPGGLALVGEEGAELARHGNRWAMLGHGITDLPRGAEVFTHDESKSIMQALNNIPAYATGTNMGAETNRIVSGINNQQPMQDGNDQVVSLLRDIAQGIKDGNVIYIDGEKVTQTVNEHNAVDNVGNYF